MTPPQKLVTLRVDSAEPNDRGQVRLDWTEAVRIYRHGLPQGRQS